MAKKAADKAEVLKAVVEFMSILKPGLPQPKLKVVNEQNDWLGHTDWDYGEENGIVFFDPTTTISLQKKIMKDERTMRRVLAHELCHHEDFLVNEAPKLEKLGFAAFEKQKSEAEGHGTEWKKIAARFNAKYGEDFITEESDQDYVIDKAAKIVCASCESGDCLAHEAAIKLDPNEFQLEWKTTKNQGGDIYTIRVEITDPVANIPLGYIKLRITIGNMYIEDVWVDQGFRRQGVGYELYLKAIAIAKQKHCKKFCQGIPREPEAEAIWQRLAQEFTVEKDDSGCDSISLEENKIAAISPDGLPVRKTDTTSPIDEDGWLFPDGNFMPNGLKIHLEALKLQGIGGGYNGAYNKGMIRVSVGSRGFGMLETPKPYSPQLDRLLTRAAHRMEAHTPRIEARLGEGDTFQKYEWDGKQFDLFRERRIASKPSSGQIDRQSLSKTAPITEDGWLLPDNRFQPNGRWTHLDALSKLGIEVDQKKRISGYEKAYAQGFIRVAVNETRAFFETPTVMNSVLEQRLNSAVKRTSAPLVYAYTGTGSRFEKWEWDGKQFDLFVDRKMAVKKTPITEDGWVLPNGVFQPIGSDSHLTALEKLGVYGYEDAYDSGFIRIEFGVNDEGAPYGFMETMEPMSHVLETQLEVIARRMVGAVQIDARVGSGSTHAMYQWDGKQFEKFNFNAFRERVACFQKDARGVYRDSEGNPLSTEQIDEFVNVAYKGMEVLFTGEGLRNEADGWFIGIDDTNSDVFHWFWCFKSTPFGRKCFAMGHDGTREAKRELLQSEKENLTNASQHYYIEASGAVEKLGESWGLPKIPVQEAAQMLPGKHLIPVDEFHYERFIAGIAKVKIMFGYPKGVALEKAASLPSELKAKLESLRPQFAAIAQKEYDAWDQSDEIYGDGEVGFGGICHLIAEAWGSMLAEIGINSQTFSHSDQVHVSLTVWGDTESREDDEETYPPTKKQIEIFDVDLNPYIYETGGGYTWKKIPDVTIDPSDISIYRQFIDQDDFEAMKEGY
jgi:hypothetical protein